MRLPSGRRVFSLGILAIVVTLAASELVADHQVILRGVLHTGSMNTFRVIAGKNGTAWDATSEGLNVGVAPDGEERIAFCRPAFMDDPRPVKGFTVVSAVPENNPLGAVYYIPTSPWDMSVPPALLFAMRTGLQQATAQYYASIFQTLLSNGNNPSGTLGVMLRSSSNIRMQPSADVMFLVTLNLPFAIRIMYFTPDCPDPRTNPSPPTPQAIPDFVMHWTSTCSGSADIHVNNRLITDLPVRATGTKEMQTLIPKAYLVRGANGISLTVQEQDASLGQTPLTTSVTLTIPDVICPWDPRRSTTGR